ncbi:hypothetical protein THRCLA_07653 [Thraustotheca clavata]|uniref:Uncharacterized protein n=1 Tax=Thraustotheca clavata TaxID=74557 RepID=A0A1V9ZCI2_9STRA|nr:hypothetical protein THRCLA_07653 [Thraustotheca clavata]
MSVPMLQGYSCPITTRTNLIQPYDIPRFVGEIIRQLHEISIWTTKCAHVLNTQSIPPTHIVSPVPSTLMTEMELIKKNLNVVEKQQANKLVSEIAYLQCALRCEADEKLLAFEHFVENKLQQCVYEQTMRLEERQKQIENRMQSVEEMCLNMNNQTKKIYSRLDNLEETMETNSTNTSQMMLKLHTECINQGKLREKLEITLGNQMTHTRLHIQDALGLFKGSHEQLVQKVDAIKTELKDAIEHVRKNIIAHEKVLNRIGRGPVGFEDSSS